LEDVVYTGRLEPDELCRVMGAALALTFVPWYEGFGIPVVEAMAAGVPVLTSNVTSLPEVGGNAVLYADPGNVDDITAGMQKLASDKNLRDNLIAAGLERAKMFSWDKTARKVWLSIDTVVKGMTEYPGR
jgi:glycosyltransferase involved in cell wall biosynthesis